MSFNGAELDHAESAKQEEIRLELLKQLEYYFSTKNLLTDNYLLSQMDAESYVPVALIAQFKRIKQLTRDLDLIIAIIRESSQLQLDPATSTKVRSVGGHAGGLITINTKKLSKSYLQTLNNSDSADSPGDKQQRCVLIMREVESGASLEQIKDLFTGKEPLCPACDQCESAGNDSWYIMFSSEEQAQRALQYLKGEVQTFLGKPIRARIKAHTTIPRSADPGAKLTTLSAVGSPPPVKVSEESPSSFLSLSPAPTVVLSESVALTYTQQTFIPQLANYYSKIPAYVPAMSAQQTQAQVPYWQMSANPKLAAYGLAPLVQSNASPAATNKLLQNTSPALSTTNDAETKPDEEELPAQVIPPQPQLFQLPQHLAQMQLNPASSYANAGNSQAAAAVHAYYQSMSSQNQAYMTPPPPPLLASSSASSLSNPVFNMNNITYSSNSGTNPSYQVNSKFMPSQQAAVPPPLAHPYMPQQAYYTINSNDNNIGENSSVPAESSGGGDSLNASFKAGSSNASAASVTPNGGGPLPHPAQVTSPSALYHPNHYLIANLNNLTMNNANSANAAAFNAAYQYYHAYNNALNTGYHPNHPQAGLHHLAHHQHHPYGGHPAPQQYFELVAGPSNAESNSEEKQTFSSKEGFTSPQQTFMHQPTSSNYPQVYPNMSAPNRSSPQLLISTMNGHNHQQHLNNNNNSNRRGGSTASLTETRFTPAQQQQPHHHHHHQQQQQQHSSGNVHYQQLNSRNNYFNKKYQTSHELGANSGGQTSTSPVTLLSPNQQHFISYNQYPAPTANPYSSYNSNHKANTAYSIYSPAYPANVNPNINGFSVATPHATLEKVDVKEEIAKTDPAAIDIADNSGFLLAKSPPINSDFVSFPPLLNSEPAVKETEATSDAAVDSLSASAQLDPAIICISNSASSIPNAPTIINAATPPTQTNGLHSSSKHFNPKQAKHMSKIIAANQRGNDHSCKSN